MRIVWILLAAMGLVGAGCAEGPEPREPPPIPAVSPEELSGSAAEEVRTALAALQAAPEDAERNGKLAMLLDAYGRSGAAAALYERAQILDPGALRWRYHLGAARLAQGDSEGAIQAFREALKADPDFAPARRALADALFQANRFEESRAAYEKALDDDPDDPRALVGLARILSATDDFGAASEKLERAVRLAPRYGAAHYELALAYRDLGRDADSRREMAAYEADRNATPPEDPLRAQVAALRVDASTRIARAAEMEQRGDLQGALREHLAALEEQPEMAQAHINLISLYGRLGEMQKAREHANTALELDPERAELHYNLGVLEASGNRLREAEAAFRKAVELNPNYAAALTNLGQMLETRQRYSEAMALYERAVESQPDYPLGHFHLGRMLLGQNKPAEAAERFRVAVQPETPRSAEAWMGLFAAYAQMGRRDDARQAAGRAKALAQRYGMTELAEAVDREMERLQ